MCGGKHSTTAPQTHKNPDAAVSNCRPGRDTYTNCLCFFPGGIQFHTRGFKCCEHGAARVGQTLQLLDAFL